VQQQLGFRLVVGNAEIDGAITDELERIPTGTRFKSNLLMQTIN
jgi:hypothetical protein